MRLLRISSIVVGCSCLLSYGYGEEGPQHDAAVPKVEIPAGTRFQCSPAPRAKQVEKKCLNPTQGNETVGKAKAGGSLLDNMVLVDDNSFLLDSKNVEVVTLTAEEAARLQESGQLYPLGSPSVKQGSCGCGSPCQCKRKATAVQTAASDVHREKSECPVPVKDKLADKCQEERPEHKEHKKEKCRDHKAGHSAGKHPTKPSSLGCPSKPPATPDCPLAGGSQQDAVKKELSTAFFKEALKSAFSGKEDEKPEQKHAGCPKERPDPPKKDECPTEPEVKKESPKHHCHRKEKKEEHKQDCPGSGKDQPSKDRCETQQEPKDTCKGPGEEKEDTTGSKLAKARDDIKGVLKDLIIKSK